MIDAARETQGDKFLRLGFADSGPRANNTVAFKSAIPDSSHIFPHER